jgi:hypothetical protein
MKNQSTREQYIVETFTSLHIAKFAAAWTSGDDEPDQDAAFTQACAMADLLEEKRVAPWLFPVA